jgi:hypothetical protein
MHFLFNLLRIKGLYMFPALLAHPQEVLHKRHWVYCASVVSVGCTITASVKNIDTPMLTRVWQELEYRIDVCRVTCGVHIKHL